MSSDLRWLWYLAGGVVGFLVLREVYLTCGPRRDRRRSLYAQAEGLARVSGKRLIVVGSPTGGLTSRVAPEHGCGDLVIAPEGCPACPNHVSGSVVDALRVLPDNSAVVFARDLEGMADFANLITQLERVSGGHLFVASVEPWSLSAFLAPGHVRRILAAPPEHNEVLWKSLPWCRERTALPRVERARAELVQQTLDTQDYAVLNAMWAGAEKKRNEPDLNAPPSR